MTQPVRLKFNRKAIREIAKSDDLELELFKRADKIRDACDPENRFGDDGYVAVSSKGKNRARAAVIAVHPHARNSNAKHNTLLRALDAGRG